MGTTNFTKIRDGNLAEIELFKGVKVGDKVIEGLCIMFTDLYHYKACAKHKNNVVWRDKM